MTNIKFDNTNQAQLFKIRSKSNKYSTGGKYPTFTKIGKVWTRIGDLKSHITLVKDNIKRAKRYHNKVIPYPYLDCEIEVTTIKITNKKLMNLDELEMNNEVANCK